VGGGVYNGRVYKLINTNPRTPAGCLASWLLKTKKHGLTKFNDNSRVHGVIQSLYQVADRLLTAHGQTFLQLHWDAGVLVRVQTKFGLIYTVRMHFYAAPNSSTGLSVPVYREIP
jgi:hypothetical protein